MSRANPGGRSGHTPQSHTHATNLCTTQHIRESEFTSTVTFTQCANNISLLFIIPRAMLLLVVLLLLWLRGQAGGRPCMLCLCYIGVLSSAMQDPTRVRKRRSKAGDSLLSVSFCLYLSLSLSLSLSLCLSLSLSLSLCLFLFFFFFCPRLLFLGAALARGS